MKRLIPLALILACAGCGTINTTLRPDAITARNLGEIDSDCSSVPRAYGGVIYGYCRLNAPENARHSGLAPDLSLTLLDMIASGVTDTLLLPYTLYRQAQDGSIAVSHEK